MYHPFSIGETVKTGWNVLKKNIVPLLVYSAISLFISETIEGFKPLIFSGNSKLSFFISVFVLMVIQAYLALSFYKLILRLMDKEYYEFDFKDVLPSFKMTFNFVLVCIAYALLIFALLFIDLVFERYIAHENALLLFVFRLIEFAFLLYLLLRSIFCVCFIVDDDSKPGESLRQSFEATKDNFVKTLAMFLIVLGFMVVVLILIFSVVQLLGLDDSNRFVDKTMFYSFFFLTFPAVQVLIMVTYRKLVYSHKDVEDDDFLETN